MGERAATSRLRPPSSAGEGIASYMACAMPWEGRLFCFAFGLHLSYGTDGGEGDDVAFIAGASSIVFI
eukprot:4263815-Pleurochrysis_carterae.AAC.1